MNTDERLAIVETQMEGVREQANNAARKADEQLSKTTEMLILQRIQTEFNKGLATKLEEFDETIHDPETGIVARLAQAEYSLSIYRWVAVTGAGAGFVALAGAIVKHYLP